MNAIQEALKILIIVLLTAGGCLVFKKYYDIKIVKVETIEKVAKAEPKNAKAALLRKYLVTQKKPERVEITGLTKRYENDVAEIKKLKIPLDKKSDFYLAISFFTNESNNTSPLVAQIRFIEISSGNLLKEESINLE